MSPAECGCCRSVFRYLDVSNNQLVGSIADSVGKLTSLQYVEECRLDAIVVGVGKAVWRVWLAGCGVRRVDHWSSLSRVQATRPARQPVDRRHSRQYREPDHRDVRFLECCVVLCRSGMDANGAGASIVVCRGV